MFDAEGFFANQQDEIPHKKLFGMTNLFGMTIQMSKHKPPSSKNCHSDRAQLYRATRNLIRPNI
jgi:hypothetical protein